MEKQIYRLHNTGATPAGEIARQALSAFGLIAGFYGAFHPRALVYLTDPSMSRDREISVDKGHLTELANAAALRCSSPWGMAGVVADAYEIASRWGEGKKPPKGISGEVLEGLFKLKWITPNGGVILEGNQPNKYWTITVEYNRRGHAFHAPYPCWFDWEHIQI